MSFKHLNIRFPIRRSGKPKVPLANDIKLAGASCCWDSPSTSQLLPSLTILFWSLFLVFCFICDTSSEYKGPTSIHLEDSGTWQTCILGFPGGRLWDKDVSANGLFAGGQVIPRKQGWEWGRETRQEKRPKRERERSSVGIWSSSPIRELWGPVRNTLQRSALECRWAALTHCLRTAGVGWYPLHRTSDQLH